MKILNWNKIKQNPQAIEFVLWSILLVVDAILNVFKNHGALWGFSVIATGLVAFFLPDSNRKNFGIAFSALLMLLPIGGILDTKKSLDEKQYLAAKEILESQKESLSKITPVSYKIHNCEFEGKTANWSKRECQSKNDKIIEKSEAANNITLARQNRIISKNLGIEDKINNLPKSVSWGAFFSDPEIFRGLLGSIFLPILQAFVVTGRRKKSEIGTQQESLSELAANEKQMPNTAINSLIELKLKEHKNDVAKVIRDLKTEYELSVYRSRIYEVKRRIQKVSDFEIGQNRTKSDSDRTLAGQEPDKVPTKTGQNLKETFVPWKVENGKG